MILFNGISITSAFLHRSSLLRVTGVLLFFSAEKLVWDAFCIKLKRSRRSNLTDRLQKTNNNKRRVGGGGAGKQSDSKVGQQHFSKPLHEQHWITGTHVFVLNPETILTRGQRARVCSHILTQQNLHNANLMPVVIIGVRSSDEKRPVFGLC